jgi:glycosyltransferase involved in cell wall biosynthesis
MKILRVISSVNPQAGGPINGLINSSNLLIEKGHLIDVVSLDDPKSSWVENFKFNLNSFKGYIGTLNFSPAFSRWLDENISKYDVVIIHGIWQYHSHATAKSCVKHNVPYVMFTHGMLDPWFNEVNKLKQVKKNIYWKLFENKVINNANTVLFTSEEEKRLARQSFLPYNPVEKVVAYGSPIPNVDSELARKSFYSLYPQLKNKKIALFLSRVHPKKGIDILIEALAKVTHLPDDFALVIAGPDHSSLQPSLEKMAKKLGVQDKIHWVGMLEGETKWGAFFASEVFVLPSHQENFGIVVAEALSTYTPVLITNKVNIWQEIEKERAGFVEPDTIDGLTSLLESWFLLSYEDKNEMNEKAGACYKKYFSIEAAVQDLESVLKDIVKNEN